MARVTKKAAVQAIEKMGACLVFPLENRTEPASLWSHFHPRTPMRWEWDAGGDMRVPELWHLREELSRSGEVAYAKWFRGRATFFALDVFSALVRVLAGDEDLDLGSEARTLYGCFEDESPLSTKEVKKLTEMQGRANEAAFQRGMKELWSRLLVVGYGERDDGAFPSLLVGASKWMLGEPWRAGRAMSLEEAERVLEKRLPEGPFRKELAKLRGTRSAGEPRA